MIVEVVGAIILDADGRLLTVRKRAGTRFILPGGKREPNEDDLAALARELREELCIAMASASFLGAFEAPAADEAGALVRSHAYFVEPVGKLRIAAEIAEMKWIDTASPPADAAPLISAQIAPALLQRSS